MLGLQLVFVQLGLFAMALALPCLLRLRLEGGEEKGQRDWNQETWILRPYLVLISWGTMNKSLPFWVSVSSQYIFRRVGTRWSSGSLPGSSMRQCRTEGLWSWESR